MPNNKIFPKMTALYVHYGDEKIPLQVISSPKLQGKVRIKIHPDCTVQVIAPENAEPDWVLNAVQHRRRWISQKLHYFRQTQPLARQYISGETHYYLGRQYLLKVFVEPDQPESVKLWRGYLNVCVHQASTEKIQSLLEKWYRKQADIVFSRRLQAVQHRAYWLTQTPPIRLRKMQRQWGNCSGNGIITLNPQLVKKTSLCIDYVILHELCHLVEHNHSQKFYRLMTAVMPEWEKVKEKLDR